MWEMSQTAALSSHWCHHRTDIDEEDQDDANDDDRQENVKGTNEKGIIAPDNNKSRGK